MDRPSSPHPATPLPPIHADMSPEELPARCESRMSQRPQLRRTSATYRLPKFRDFDNDDDEDDYDDDDDPIFSSARRAAPFTPQTFYDPDEDDDEDFGELIRFRLDDTDMDAPDAEPFPPHSLAPLLLPQAAGPSISDDDFFSNDTPPVYHGFSYHALALVKRVWNSRRAQLSHHRPVHPNSGSPDPSTAYDGIAVAPSEPDYPLPEDYAPPAAATPPPESRIAVSDPDVPIYPRLGDMSSIRDGRGASVDRAFCNFPLYTIRKVLYLHDMLGRAADCASSGDVEPSSALERVARARVDEETVGVLCDQFERAMVLDVSFPVSAKGWSPVSFARWRILLEKATGKQAPLGRPEGGDVLSGEAGDRTRRFERAPQRPKTPQFFLLDDDDDDEDEDEDALGPERCRARDSDDESDEDGWDEINLENSPGRRAVSAPVFFLDRRAMPMSMGHHGIMAH
ncbi:uncharacterized protein B0H18DRAFT_1013078 [Fomitopsis serialis]|uniref:uncharacterized protein n=1 Tax=Fomitopsis serialis TaxID=139415 RepID=UPI00200794C2|nr:uncharacterized protein B0H18DRAFT_1013078 [Neoantrodia serialis]KAH9924022.1 hypothetical protein B0H18DRAFT_1013078 [Neoantrodia serialis]